MVTGADLSLSCRSSQEDVALAHLHPRQLALLLAELVAEPGELLLACQVPPAGLDPFLA